MRKHWMFCLGLLSFTTIANTAAHAINHTDDYETNIGNYRTCTSPLLDSCSYADILSPSLYYFANNTKTTVIAKANGDVQLRIDSGSLLHDTNVSYSCLDQTFACVSGTCTGPKAPTACTVNRCIGGTNDGGVCSSSTACPGGACTGGASCVVPACQGGPRDDKECGGAHPACTSVANSTGWSVVFRGNQNWAESTPDGLRPYLRGDGDSGCMKVCPFDLNGSGAINSNKLNSCSNSGPCGGVETFHHVEIRDPQGEIVGIPTLGPALTPLDYWFQPGDPARVGDCNRAANDPYCP